MSDEALAREKLACGGDYRDRKAPSSHRVCEEQNPSELLLQRKAVKPQSTREGVRRPQPAGDSGERMILASKVSRPQEVARLSDDIATRLGEVRLFAGCPKRVLRQLIEGGREVDHKPGREVAAEGRGAAAFHYVMDGSAQVTVGGSARGELKPGDYFGEISLIDGKPRSATVKAGDDGMKTFAIDRFEFNQVIKTHPDVAHTLLVNVCGRLRQCEAARSAMA